MRRFVYGFICGFLVAVCVVYVFGFPFSLNLFSSHPQPEIDMYKRIQEEIPNGYSILTYDWTVWSKTFKDSGGILTKMDTWEQFKESYRQSIGGLPIMLDQENHVVWFKGSANQAVYYEY